MIYLPSDFGRWWICPKLGVDRPSRFHARIGWCNDDVRQTTLTEYLDINEHQYIRAMVMLIPLEDRVYEALGYRDMTERELEYATPTYWQNIGTHTNCTMRTALKRLMKQGKISRKLHARGWFQWYVYSRID